MAMLAGKVILITGAAMGQGEAEARECMAQGARVIIADVAEERGRAVAAELGDAALFQRLDVRSAADWAAAVAAAEERFGPIDGLVNNAGISMRVPIADLTEEEVRRVFEINQLGPLLGLQAVLEPMKRAGGGAIVNIGSVVGVRPLPGVGSYAATKWAMRGLTRVAAREFAQWNIRVNIVHPGMIDTPMISNLAQEGREAAFKTIPLGRIGQPSDIASAVSFLLSDGASFITGAELSVDGGRNA
jgi:3alpha(or 20beta)-hydroxysteroid dehydrogenase